MKVKTSNIKITSDVEIFCFIFIIALIKSSLFSHVGFGLLDEGESLHNANRILLGEVPYRDFFAIFPPLDNYFFAFIFNIFGKSVVVPRLVMSVIFSFTPGIMFLIIAKYSNKIPAMIPPLLLIFLDLNVERLYFFTPIFFSIYLLNKNYFLSGFLLGLASLIRFDIPGTFLIGMLVVTFLNSLKQKKNYITLAKNLLTILLGYSLLLVAACFWMIRKGIFSLFLKSTFIDSLLITKLHDLPFPKVTSVIPTNLSLSALSVSYQSIYAYFVIVVLFLFFMLLLFDWKKIFEKNLLLLGLFIAALLNLPYVFGRTDMGHIIKGTMPVLFIAPYLFSNLNKKQIFTKSLFYLFTFLFFVANIAQNIWWLNFNNQKIQINSFNLKVNKSSVPGSTVVSGETIKNSVLFLKDSANKEKVLALPYMAGLYFLADRMPPSEFNNLLAGFITTKEKEEEFISKMKSNNVRKIVYARDSGPKMSQNKLYEYNSLIDDYIMRNYEVLKKTEEGWLFMIKK